MTSRQRWMEKGGKNEQWRFERGRTFRRFISGKGLVDTGLPLCIWRGKHSARDNK